MRAVKQLVVIQGHTPNQYTGGGNSAPTLYALCEDGTIWEKEGNDWIHIPGPPAEHDRRFGPKKKPKRKRKAGPRLSGEVAPNRLQAPSRDGLAGYR